MSINCEIILQWNATPQQLSALGSALWGWCSRTAGASGIYRYLDNQALADLIAGKLPQTSQPSWQAGRRGIRFRIWDETSPDPQATIDSLRREIPANGVEDIVVDGKSWQQRDS